MLVPITNYVPVKLTGTTPSSICLESQMPAKPVLFGRIRFINKASVDLTFSIDETEDMGTSNDPMFNGSFTTNLLTVIVVPNQVIWYEFQTPHLGAPGIFNGLPELTHNIGLLNAGASATDEVCASWTLYGLWEQTLAPPTISAV